MAAYKTAAPLLSIPDNSGVAVTPSGVASTFGAWAQLTASAATDMRLATVIALPGERAVGNYFAIQIGTGTAGNEVAVTEVRGDSGNDPNADAGDVIMIAIPADVITAGQRVAARIRQVSTSVTAWTVSFQYWALPITATSDMPAASVGQVYYPTSPITSTIVSGAGVDVNSAWQEVIAATDAPWTIGNIVCVGQGPNFSNWELDIGVGASGSEAVKWTIKSRESWTFIGQAWEGAPWNILLRPPLGPIAAGLRVAIRIRSTEPSWTYKVAIGVTKEDVDGCATDLVLTWTAFDLVPATTGGINNYGAWKEFIASASTDILICSLISTTANIGETHLQIGIGVAGNEEVVAEFAVAYGVGFSGGRFSIPLPYPRRVPAGSRVAIRMAISALSATSNYYAIGYLEVPMEPDFDSWTNSLVQEFYPTTAMVTDAVAWTSGAWSAVDASVPTDRVITAYMWANPANVEVEVDLGIGEAGSETVVTTIRWASGCNNSDCSLVYMLLPIPAILPEASRFAVRARCSAAGAQTIKITPHYTAEPADDPDPTPSNPVLTTTRYNVRWLRRVPHVSDTGQRIFHKRLQVDCEVGRISDDDPLPVIYLRSSDDGGYTWSADRAGSVGKLGDYVARCQWHMLGSARDRVYEIWSDYPVQAVLQGWLEAEEGRW